MFKGSCLKEERFLGKVKTASSPAPVPELDTPGWMPSTDAGLILEHHHVSRICQRASFRAKNVEPKLLGKLTLVSEFPHSKSRRKLSRQRGEMWPSRGRLDLPVLRCSVHLSLAPQDTQMSGQRLGDAGSGFGTTAGGSESPEPRPTGLTHLGFFSSQILKQTPTPPVERAGFGQLVDTPSLPRPRSSA